MSEPGEAVFRTDKQCDTQWSCSVCCFRIQGDYKSIRVIYEKANCDMVHIFPPDVFLFSSSYPNCPIKENIAVDFFGEASASCEICEQACISSWCKRGKQPFLIFMGALNFGMSIPSNMQLVFILFLIPGHKGEPRKKGLHL